MSSAVSSAAALVFYLPGVCTHTDTEGKQRKARVQNIFKNSEKNTIFNEHPVVATSIAHMFFFRHFRHVRFLPALNPGDLSLELLDLVDLPLPAVLGGNLEEWNESIRSGDHAAGVTDRKGIMHKRDGRS